jgi:hypothetical protein
MGNPIGLLQCGQTSDVRYRTPGQIAEFEKNPKTPPLVASQRTVCHATLLLLALASLASCAGDPTAPSTDDPATEPAGGGAGGNAPADAGSTPVDAGPRACTGADIAAFADQLVNRGRKSCTADGVGVVTDTNYGCLRDPIDSSSPAFPDAAYQRIIFWAQNGNNYAGKTTLFQCVDFAFAVTAGACGQPINGGDAQIGTKMNIPGYTYMTARDGAAQPGDVLVMDGHIALVAEVIGGTRIRIAEANYLLPDGRPSDGWNDTGVISNTRIDGLTDRWILGYYRRQ